MKSCQFFNKHSGRSRECVALSKSYLAHVLVCPGHRETRQRRKSIKTHDVLLGAFTSKERPQQNLDWDRLLCNSFPSSLYHGNHEAKQANAHWGGRQETGTKSASIPRSKAGSWLSAGAPPSCLLASQDLLPSCSPRRAPGLPEFGAKGTCQGFASLFQQLVSMDENAVSVP